MPKGECAKKTYVKIFLKPQTIWSPMSTDVLWELDLQVNNVWSWKILNGLQKLFNFNFWTSRPWTWPAISIQAHEDKKLTPWKKISISSFIRGISIYHPFEWASCYNPGKKEGTGIGMWEGHASFHMFCSMHCVTAPVLWTCKEVLKSIYLPRPLMLISYLSF